MCETITCTDRGYIARRRSRGTQDEHGVKSSDGNLDSDADGGTDEYESAYDENETASESDSPSSLMRSRWPYLVDVPDLCVGPGVTGMVHLPVGKHFDSNWRLRRG